MRLKTYRRPARRRADRAVSALLVVAVVAVVAATAWLLAPEARAASDGPTPYTVDQAGITLPAGDVFPAHGHVNVRWTDPAGSVGIHFDPNNGHPGGRWIGKRFIPWSAFGVPQDACITWVQISHHDAHFGEGGQDPVCLTQPAPEPTPAPSSEPSPEPEPTPDPSPSFPSPDPSPTPTPEPSTGPSPGPSPSPEPTRTPDPSPTSSPRPEPEPTPGPTPSPDLMLECPEGKAPGWLDEDGEPTACVDDDPDPWPDPIPTPTPECPGRDSECDAGDRCATVVDCSEEDPTPDPAPEPAPTKDPEPEPTETPAPPPWDELPQTGVGDVIVWALVVLGLLGTGAALVEHSRRRKNGLR